MTADTLESLRTSFNRRLRAEGKADRTLVLYGQSITYFSQWLAQEGLRADLDSLTRPRYELNRRTGASDSNRSDHASTNGTRI